MIYKIIKDDNLEAALLFIGKGFQWQSHRIMQVREYIKKSNNKKLFYGFYMLDENSEICSAVLTPFQGEYNDRYIISLMSWYSIPSERGINSILFMKYLTNYLISKDFIITDYTPTKNVNKILNYLGFQIMEGLKIKTLLPLKPIRILNNLLVNKNNLNVKSGTSKKYNDFFKLSSQGDLLICNFENKNVAISFLGNNTFYIINLLGYKIKIKTFHILFADEEKILLKNWYKICFLLFKKFGSIYISGDFFQEEKYLKNIKFKFYELKYMIYDVKNSLKFVPSLGSELTLKSK